MRTRTAVAVTLVAVVCIGLSVAAQKKPKPEQPPFKWPGIADFRSDCDLAGPPFVECTPSDLIVGDGGNYAFVPEQAGAGMYSGNGNLHINLAYPRYRVRLDFSRHIDRLQRSCLTVGPKCRWYGDGPVVLESAEIQGAVVDEAGNRLDRGLWTIPDGGSGRSELRIGWWQDGIQWQLRFQPALYAGSDDVAVRRTACTWVFTTDGGELAGLNGWGPDPNSKGGRNVTTNEGLFQMPTEITLTLVPYPGYSMPTECQ